MYDAFYNIWHGIDKRWDFAKVESYTYYSDGLMKDKLDRNGVTTTYTYDVHGRLLAQTAGSLSIANTYDQNSNKLTMTDATGITTRTYDALNRCLTKTVPNIGTIAFTYDKTDGVAAGNTKEISTDPKGNVTAKVFDKVGRMKEVTNNDGQKTTYLYYDNGQKQAVIYHDNTREDYTYYANGKLYTLINKNKAGATIATYAYDYDKAGNQIQKIESTTGTTNYVYDDLNRLLEVDEPE